MDHAEVATYRDRMDPGIALPRNYSGPGAPVITIVILAIVVGILILVLVRGKR